MTKRLIALFFSILTACATGGMIALFSIFAFDFIKNEYFNGSVSSVLAEQPQAELVSTALLEEADQDPSFVSRFSRVFIYSADDNKEIIEGVKNSLPRSPNLEVTATAYMVLDLDRNVEVLEKNPHKLLPIASITKLVTAVVAKKLMDEDESVTVTREALVTYGNEARLREGEKFKVKELFYPLLMVSSNDSSEVIAQAYGRKDFIQKMNQWVNSIGAYRTYFDDPSGLSAKNVSTAEDLGIILKWIYDNEPEILDITLEKSKSIRTHTWVNPTHFLNIDSYAGGKNGFTYEANRTSVALFKLGNQQKLYAVTLLGSESRDSDILDLLEEAVR